MASGKGTVPNGAGANGSGSGDDENRNPGHSRNGYHGVNGKRRSFSEVVGPPQGEDQVNFYAEHMSLRELAERTLSLLMRRKWTVLIVLVLVIGGVTAYTLTLEPVYESSGLVMVSGQGVSSTLPASDMGGLFTRSDRSTQNELLVLRHSDALRKAVAERLLEQQVIPDTDRPLLVTQTHEGRTRAVDDVASRVGRMVSFSEAEGGTRAIRMTGRGSDPHEVAFVTSVFMDEYVNMTQRASRSSLRSARVFLEEQVEQRFHELDEIEGEIMEYMQQEGAVALEGEGRRLIQRIGEVESNRDAAEIRLRTRRASLELKEEELRSISPGLAGRIASGVERDIQTAQQRIAEAEQARRELRNQSEDRITDAERAQMEQIEQRIQRYRAEVEELSEKYVDEVLSVGGVGLTAGQGLTHVTDLQRNIAEERIAISELEAEMSTLAERLAGYEEELQSVPAQAQQLAQLRRTQSYTEGMYRNVMQQLQEISTREQSEQGYANRINEVAVPNRPVDPSIPWNLTLGAVLGLLLGLVSAIGRDRLDARLYQPEQSQQESGQRLLGVVPDLQPFIKKKFKGSDHVQYRDRRVDTSLVTALTPTAPPSEAYRQVRTNLMLGPYGDRLKTIMVTSPGMGDGKSVTAGNLAVTMAQNERQTLLLDCDFRRPRMHKLLGTGRTPGLTDYLMEGPGGDVSVHPTVVDNLYALSAGSAVNNPAELLGSQSFRTLLEALRDHFDVVILDTPPVLVAADASVLAARADGVAIVARSAGTTSPELTEAIRTLTNVGSSVEGVIFNAFAVSSAYGYKLRYRNYGQYGHYGYYGAGEDEEEEPVNSTPMKIPV